MGKVEVRIPHVVWRGGRPRFSPGPKLRALGFAGRDLCDVPARDARRMQIDAGWWSLDRVQTWLRDELKPAIAAAEARAAGAATRRRVRAALGDRHTAGPTVAELVAWGKHRPKIDDTPLSPESRRFYDEMADALADTCPDFWLLPARAVRTAQVFNALESIKTAKSLHVAQGVRALLGRSWKAARLREWKGIVDNPCSDISLPKPDGRLRSATVAEVRALVAAADHLGWPEIGDAIVMGATQGQRQGDRFAVEATAIRDGWLRIEQQKTGAVVEIRIGEWLRDRLAAAAERRRDWPVAPLAVIVNEVTRRPFQSSTYNRRFNLVRDLAVAGIERDGAVVLAPTKSLAGFRDQDLRDTFVTWAIEAGMTAEQIAAVTGHTSSTVQAMLDRHYGVKTRPQALAVATAIDIKIRSES